jgi:hypothetical protein
VDSLCDAITPQVWKTSSGLPLRFSAVIGFMPLVPYADPGLPNKGTQFVLYPYSAMQIASAIPWCGFLLRVVANKLVAG